MGEPLTRRRFLSLAALAGGSVFAGELARKLGKIPGTSEVFRETDIDGVTTIGADKQLTGEEFEKFEESTNWPKEREGLVRRMDFLVGEKTIEEWKKRGGAEESFHLFLKKHIDKLNQILAATRQSSGISNLTLVPRVLIVEDSWLETQDFSTKQVSLCKDAVGRFSIDPQYRPGESGYFYNGFDNGLIHEMVHYGLFNQYHLWWYFGKNNTWRSNIDVSGQKREFDTSNILVWKPYDGNIQDRRKLLEVMKEPPTAGRKTIGSLLSEPDELCIRNACLNGHNFSNWVDLNEREPEVSFGERSLATSYLFAGQGLRSAKLYAGNTVEVDWIQGSIKTKFADAPSILEVKPDGVVLPPGLVSGSFAPPDAETSQRFPGMFLLETEDSVGVRQVYGLSGWHLAYWHWKEQLSQGENGIGINGKQYSVTINFSEFA